MSISADPPLSIVRDPEIVATTKIAEVSPTVDVDYVDFTGLDINADGIYVLYSTVGNPLTVGCIYYCFVEGDYTLTNYYNQYIYAYGTSLSANRINNPAIFYNFAGEGISVITYILRDLDGYFRFISFIPRRSGGAIEQLIRMGCKTATVTNITSIRIQASQSGGIKAGSRFTLCKGWI